MLRSLNFAKGDYVIKRNEAILTNGVRLKAQPSAKDLHEWLRLILVLYNIATGLTLLKMAPILTKKKVNEFLAAGNDIAIPVLSLVADASGAFPPLQSAAKGALFIANNLKVSGAYPKRQSMFLLTVHVRASARARKSGMSSAAMSRRWLARLHCDGRRLVTLVQKNH